MADRSHAHQLQVHSQQPHRYEGGMKSILPQSGGPSASKIIAVVTLLPTGAGLLGLSSLALFFSLVGLALATPVFIICSPVLVPAAFAVAMALAAFFTSAAIGLTGLSSLSWTFQYFRKASEQVPQQVEEVKRRMQDVAVQMGQKTKEVGQAIEKKAQETK